MADESIAYDCVLLLSFGGPEGPDDVLPFLQNVTRGRGVPRERLERVADQYRRFGGVSPINGQCRALVSALRRELDSRGRGIPIYWGNRNWHPLVEDTMRTIMADGHRAVLAVSTSAYSSYSSCRQYHEDLERARNSLTPDDPGVPAVAKVRPYWNHPGFVAAMADRVRAAVDQLSSVDGARMVFTAHSIPESMARTSDYERQLTDAAELVVGAVDWDGPWDVAYQLPRSGPPQVPWLEPDIGAHLRALRPTGTDSVVVVPIGFTSDHQEVVFDLDTEAAEVAEAIGMTFIRAGTVGTHPSFVAGLADLLDEHLVGAEPRWVGPLGPRAWPCPPGCCPAPARRG